MQTHQEIIVLEISEIEELESKEAPGGVGIKPFTIVWDE
jgi:hypothetical protein